MASRWTDSPQRYGLVTRLLHWSMAALFAWQFLGMGVKLLLGRHAVTAFFVGTHKPVGTLLMLLILLRGAWGLSQWRNRPPHPPTLVGRLAVAGHAVLYALMFYVPAVALLREYGSGRGFAPWGIPLFPATGEQVAWMLAPANLSHGVLAWTLLALVAGHVAMVAVHQWWWRDATLARMSGRL
ncbi:cytochrome b [Luteimonas sp. BDR2-5]|uniref:cytochrome b n=1 Tax=Proluteimonas luteida TaxID=2878685 RepID=UPI001E5846B8|nr:cytochrome b [Luteimonas sp. BDR2-5]MCD9028491.1 cytochrome b [Luteimonas sp. BDR2-5]